MKSNTKNTSGRQIGQHSLTCSGVQYGDVWEFVQFVKLYIPLSLFTIMVHLCMQLRKGENKRRKEVMFSIQCSVCVFERDEVCAYIHLPEYEVLSDDGLDRIITPHIPV